MKLSKRARANAELRPAEALEVPQAVAAVKKFKAPKFNQTVNVVVYINLDSKSAEQGIRGSVSLPKGIGKAKRVIAFCREDVAKLAKEAGAIEAGAEDLVAKIEGGWMDFDVAIASPDMMRIASKLGKVLGPKGLMPTPKNGTVTPQVAEAVKEFAAGKVEFRADKVGNIHCIIGKMNFPEADLAANLDHFIKTIEKARPSSARGQFVKKVFISGCMTPSVQVKVAQVVVEE
ncbi:MAG: 50S ribosomal protein L1 [Phycisphaerales bacterium]